MLKQYYQRINNTKVLFFGDSITSGENNNFISYVDKLGLENIVKFGFSGTTLGDYSLYPVNNHDLLNLLYKNTDSIKEAQSIFLEYGANDISSIITGYATFMDVYISLIKCLDYIKQINPNADIYCIPLNPLVPSKEAKGQINYTIKDYFKGISIKLNRYK